MTKELIAREDAEQLRYHAASLTYNDTTAEGEAKHRLHEIAMRIETGYYASDALQVAEFDKHRIEVLQARVADQSAQLTRHTNLIDQLQEERCKLAAELAAARAQEPVSHRYRFTHPISGEPVWRDSSPMWNGQCVQEVQPLFASPSPASAGAAE